MSNAVEQIIVDPSGVSMVVDIFDKYGNSTTTYTDVTGATPRSLPLTISTPTGFFLRYGGDYTVSAKVNGVEIAGPRNNTLTVPVADRVPVTVTPTVQDLEVLAGVGGGGSAASLTLNKYVEAELDNAAQVIANNTPTVIKFDTIGYVDATADITAPAIDGSDSIWTINADGLYVVAVEADWADSAAGLRQLRILFTGPNNSFPLFGVQPTVRQAPTATAYRPTLTCCLPLMATSTVNFEVLQTSGGNLSVTFAQGSVVRVL